MFATEIKKHIVDVNARIYGGGVSSSQHQRTGSQPAGTSKTAGAAGQIKISSMPLSSNTGKLAEGGAGGSGSGGNRAVTSGPDINDLMARQAVPRGQTAEAGTRNAAGKINMEAYEAYHNSKDNALLLSQTQSEELGNKHETTQKNNQKVAPKTEEIKSSAEIVGKEKNAEGGEVGADGKKSPTTVTTNNYTTVMQNGANINITNINNHHTYVIYR